MTNRMMRAAGVLLVAVALGACSDTATGPQVTPELTLNASMVELDAVGRELQLQVTGHDEASDVLEAHMLTWTSSDHRVALVESDGTVIARGDGDAVITVAYSESVQASAAVQVRASAQFTASLMSARNQVMDPAAAASSAEVVVHARE